MSRKKIKKILEKKQWGTYMYPQTLDDLSKVSENIGVSKTEIVEAATVFFCSCPSEFQERIFQYYQFQLAKWTSSSEEYGNLEQVLDAFLARKAKKNDESES